MLKWHVEKASLVRTFNALGTVHVGQRSDLALWEKDARVVDETDLMGWS